MHTAENGGTNFGTVANPWHDALLKKKNSGTMRATTGRQSRDDHAKELMSGKNVVAGADTRKLCISV
jgi:hypothetical protein